MYIHIDKYICIYTYLYIKFNAWNCVLYFGWMDRYRRTSNITMTCVYVYNIDVGSHAGVFAQIASMMALARVQADQPWSPVNCINDINVYPLVMTNIANWKITMRLMGKLTISMAIFSGYAKWPEGSRGYFPGIYVMGYRNHWYVFGYNDVIWWW